MAHKRPPIDDRWDPYSYRDLLLIFSPWRWMIFFVDVQYNTTQSGRGWPFGQQGVLEFTSTVSVVHRNGTDFFPYTECHGEECRRKNIRKTWPLIDFLQSFFYIYFNFPPHPYFQFSDVHFSVNSFNFNFKPNLRFAKLLSRELYINQWYINY